MDIGLRFHKDMLVLGSPVAAVLERLGVDTARDMEFTLLFEPETLEKAYELEALTGAQCVVASTGALTPARLAHARMEDKAEELAAEAMRIVHDLKPQHILVEVNPCDLPLDPESKQSLVEHRDQYARAAKLFAESEFDAFFLNGFTCTTDLKCALMGVRKVSDAPVFASVNVDADGMLTGDGAAAAEAIEEAAAVMAEYGAQVVGFATEASIDAACACVARMREGAQGDTQEGTPLPVLAQLVVEEGAGSYPDPDAMVECATALRAAGAQFLRAAGDATPAYAGALVAATLGSDVL